MKNLLSILAATSFIFAGHLASANVANTNSIDTDTATLDLALKKDHAISKLINSRIKKYGESVNEVDEVSAILMQIDEDADVTKIDVQFSPYSRSAKKNLSCKGTVVVGPEATQYSLINDSCEAL